MSFYSALILGFGIGAVITAFTFLCIDAAERNFKITDAEMEAWEEHLRRREEEKL